MVLILFILIGTPIVTLIQISESEYKSPLPSKEKKKERKKEKYN